MGFIEDVENVLTQAPAQHQAALFSVTMPEWFLEAEAFAPPLFVRTKCHAESG
ncbi:MAG: ATP-dependent RNA helicase DeaD [Sodalis sp.]|nr:MAG: ATP-dependent RNA helicase DeaD [Sodalis sp.]